MTADPRPSPVGPEEALRVDLAFAGDQIKQWQQDYAKLEADLEAERGKRLRVVIRTGIRLANLKRALRGEQDRSRGLARLLDHFDRYASVEDGTPYAGSPFEAEVKAALASLAAVPREGERPEKDDGNEGFAPVPAGEGADGAADAVYGATCRVCRKTMELPVTERDNRGAPTRVSIVEAEGWTFTMDDGWACPAHSEGAAPAGRKAADNPGDVPGGVGSP